MKEHFGLQLGQSPAGPVTLYYMVTDLKRIEDGGTIKLYAIAYSGVGDINLPEPYELVEMSNSIPIFQLTK